MTNKAEQLKDDLIDRIAKRLRERLEASRVETA